MLKKLISILLFSGLFYLSAFPSGSYNVRDFGAIGDGNNDDTRAIQLALNKIEKERNEQKKIIGSMTAPSCGVWSGAHGELYFPAGIYRITSTLVGGEGIKISGSPSAIIDSSGVDGPALYFQKAFRITIENMEFQGGLQHILFWTANLDSAGLLVRNCTFRDSTGYALSCVSYTNMDSTKPIDWDKVRPMGPYEVSWENEMPILKPTKPPRTWANSTRLVVRDSRFIDCAGMYKGHGDAQFFANCEFNSSKAQKMSIIDANASLMLRNMKAKAIPNGNPWISYGGNIMARNLNFIATDANGAPLLDYKKSYPKPKAYNEYNNVLLEDCSISVAGSEIPALVLIRDCPPALLTLRRCREAGGKQIEAVNYLKAVEPEKTLFSPAWEQLPKLEDALGIVFEDNHQSIKTALPTNLEAFRRSALPLNIEMEEFTMPDLEGRTVIIANTLEELKAALLNAASAEKPLIKVAGKTFALDEPLELPENIVIMASGHAMFELKEGVSAFKATSEKLDIVISGIIVSGGLYTGEFKGSGKVLLDNCHLYDNQGITVTSPDPAKPLLLQISNSTLFTIRGVANQGGKVWISDTWASNRPVLDNGGFFRNKGELRLRNIVGVPIVFRDQPNLNWKYGNNIHWVENHGDFFSQDVRYGGEFGGIPAVRNLTGGNVTIEGHYAYFFSQYSPKYLILNENPDARILIRDLNSLPSKREDSGILKGIEPKIFKYSNVLHYQN